MFKGVHKIRKLRLQVQATSTPPTSEKRRNAVYSIGPQSTPPSATRQRAALASTSPQPDVQQSTLAQSTDNLWPDPFDDDDSQNILYISPLEGARGSSDHVRVRQPVGPHPPSEGQSTNGAPHELQRPRQQTTLAPFHTIMEQQKIAPLTCIQQQICTPISTDQKTSLLFTANQKTPPPVSTIQETSPPVNTDQKTSPVSTNQETPPPVSTDWKTLPFVTADQKTPPPVRTNQKTPSPVSADQKTSPVRSNQDTLPPVTTYCDQQTPPHISTIQQQPVKDQNPSYFIVSGITDSISTEDIVAHFQTAHCGGGTVTEVIHLEQNKANALVGITGIELDCEFEMCGSAF